LYSLLRDGSRLLVSILGNNDAYFYAYWGFEPLDVALTFLAVQESFFHVFGAFRRFDWFVGAFWGSLVLAIIYAVWKSSAYPPAQASAQMSWIISVELIGQYGLTAICLLYFIFLRAFRIKWTKQESWVVTGFALTSTFFVVAGLIRSVFGVKMLPLSQLLPPVGYLAAQICWLIGAYRGLQTLDARPARVS
jgi:hypothetical protein